MKWKFEILCWLAITIQLAVAIEDCYELGVKYTGNTSTTVTGLICQRWDSQIPHNHTHGNNTEAVENYCRSIKDDKPWCYTTDEGIRWEYCAVPECVPILLSKDSSVDASAALGHSPVDTNFNDAQAMTDMYDCYEDGGDYKGNVSTTVSGLTCQRWDSQVPHNHTHENDPEAIENYCRILADDRPWCYTTDVDVRWEFCPIKTCGELRAERMLNMLNADSATDGASKIVVVNDADAATGGTDGSNATSGGTDVGVSGGADAGLDAGLSVGTDAGPDVGVTGDTATGLGAGVSGATDTILDAGVSGGTDTGLDAGLSVGTDAGLDAGVTGGTDVGLSGGIDAGVTGGSNIPISGGADVDAGANPSVSEDLGRNGNLSSDTSLTSGDAQSYSTTTSQLNGYATVETTQQTYTVTDANTNTVPLGDPETTTEKMKTDELSVDPTMVTKTNVNDKITTKGPGALYVMGTEETKTSPPATGNYEVHSVSSVNSISVADPVQTPETDLNPDVSIARLEYSSPVNEKVTIRCKVVPSDQLPIVWHKDGKLLENGGVTVRTGSILILNNIQVEDAGKYTCKAGNSEATTTLKILQDTYIPVDPPKKPEETQAGTPDVTKSVTDSAKIDYVSSTSTSTLSSSTSYMIKTETTTVPYVPDVPESSTQSEYLAKVTAPPETYVPEVPSTYTDSTSVKTDDVTTTTQVPEVPKYEGDSSTVTVDDVKSTLTTPTETPYIPDVPDAPASASGSGTINVDIPKVPEVPRYVGDSSTVTVEDIKSTLTTPTETPYLPGVPDVPATGSGTVKIDVPKVPEVPRYEGDSRTVAIDDVIPTETPYIPEVPEVPATGPETVKIDVPKVPVVPRYEGDSSTVTIDDVKSTLTTPTETPYVPAVPDVSASDTGSGTIRTDVSGVPRYEGDSRPVKIDDVKSTLITPTESPYVPAILDVSAPESVPGPVNIVDVKSTPATPTEPPHVPRVPIVPISDTGSRIDDVKGTLSTPTDSPYVPAVPDVPGTETGSKIAIDDIKSTAKPFVPGSDVDSSVIIKDVTKSDQFSGTESLNPDDVINTLTPTDTRRDEVKFIKDTEPFAAREKTVSVRTDVKLRDVARQDTLYRPANPSYVSTSYNDGCASKCGDSGSCYVEYNCTHFEHCFEIDGSYCTCILRQCSFGTFWNSEIGNCDSVSNVFCKNDPCIDKPALSTYASGFNCRSFYQCNGLGRSMSMCCDEKYSYDPDSGDCVYNPNCDIGCTSRTPKYKKEPEVRPQVTESYNVCYFRAIINKPTKYFNDVFRIEQSCPPGTVYRSDICVCGDPINRDYEIPPDAYFRRCVPRISIDFSDDKVENKSPRKVYINNEDVKITSSGRKGVAYGTFNGRTSQIESARYNGVQFPKLLVRMRFYSDDRYGAPYQVLFSNCESTAKPWDIRELKPDENPSVAIILSKDEGRLTFLGYSEDKRVKPAIIRLDYSKKNWNNVELMYDGASFNARVRSVNPDGTIAENKDSKPLTGKLATSRQPIRIGKCSKSNAFYGFIDVIKMFDCIPN